MIINEGHNDYDSDAYEENIVEVNVEEINERYDSRRNEVLAKHPSDITRDDLNYLKLNDPIFRKLSSKHRRELILMDEANSIFSQIPELVPFLKDDTVSEINLNQDGFLRVLKFGVGKFKTNFRVTPEKAINLINLIAHYNNDKFDEETAPIISSNLPSGERIECLAGRVVKGCPVFSLRKRATRIFTLDEYVESEKLTEFQLKVLREQIAAGKNIMIVGTVGTGKTTFINACLNELKTTSRRVIIIEDTPELNCEADDRVEMVTTKYVDALTILRSTMRLNGDVLVFGETRKGSAALALLTLWNSGSQGGFSTIHADDTLSGLKKIEQYAGEDTEISQAPYIAQTVNCVVCLKKDENHRNYVSEISLIKGHKDGEYIIEKIA